MNNTLVIKAADITMISQLSELWCLCFPQDRPEDADAFYREFFGEIVCLVGLVNGQVVTMLHLLPATAYCYGVPRRVRYLYAGGTHPAHRHHGYYAKLMQFASEYVAKSGESGIYLHPATPSLIPLYEKSGYRLCIHTSAPMPTLPHASVKMCDAATFADHRHCLLQNLQFPGVYFEPDTRISAAFLAPRIREGDRLYRWKGGSCVMSDGVLCHSIPPIASDEAVAMWLGVGECDTVLPIIESLGGFTALLGE